MKSLTTNTKRSTLMQGIIAAVIVTVASSAHSAAYIKFDGVDGESKSKPTPQQVDSKQKPRPAALLLPAVQKVREAAPRTPKPSDSTAGDEHEVEYDLSPGV